MSTNYYWLVKTPPAVTLPTGEVIGFEVDHCDPRIHLGKFTGGRFIWAQPPGSVRAICLIHPDELLVSDEYGDNYECNEFLAILEGTSFDTDSIGAWFS